MNRLWFFTNQNKLLDNTPIMGYNNSMSKRKKKTKKKIRKTAIKKTWDNGDNPIGLNLVSPMSYESYMKTALETFSKRFQVRTYKLAPAEDYPQFIRGKDLRVQIWFDKKYLGYEFLIEIPFWVQTNRNKEDRNFMRRAANVHLKYIHEQVEKAKAKFKKNETSAPKKKTRKKTTKKTGITTQDAFDKNIAKKTSSRRKKAAKRK